MALKLLFQNISLPSVALISLSCWPCDFLKKLAWSKLYFLDRCHHSKVSFYLHSLTLPFFSPDASVLTSSQGSHLWFDSNSSYHLHQLLPLHSSHSFFHHWAHFLSISTCSSLLNTKFFPLIHSIFKSLTHFSSQSFWEKYLHSSYHFFLLYPLFNSYCFLQYFPRLTPVTFSLLWPRHRLQLLEYLLLCK